MRRISAITRTAVVMMLFTWLSACSSQPPTPAKSPPTHTDIPVEPTAAPVTPEARAVATQTLPEPTAPPSWDYVAIGGDFTYAQNWDKLYAGYMEDDLEVPVNFSDLSTHDFMTWNGWLERLKNEEQLRSALQGAEAVTFDVPLEAYFSMPIAMYQNKQCGGDDGENCYRQRVEQLRQDLDAFLAELTALADPSQVVVRTVLRGSIPAFYGEGVGEGFVQDFSEAEMQALIKYMLAANEVVRQATAAHGIPAVDLPATLQPDGPDTPPASEYLLMLGLSEAGDQEVADLLRQAGYESSPQAEVTLREEGCSLGVYANPVPNPIQVKVANPTNEIMALVVVTLKEDASRYDLLEFTGGGIPDEVDKRVAHPEPGPNNEMITSITLEEGRENYFVCAQPEKVLAVPGALTPGQAYQPFPPVRAVREVPYTKPVSATAQEFKLDIYAPKQAGLYPVVVFLHGGNTSKDDPVYQELFTDLVMAGAVVLSAQSFENSGGALARADKGAGIRHDHENAACAVRYARAVAPQYSGDPKQVILIGHSGGGYTGLWVTLAGDQLDQAWETVASQGGPPRQVECLAGQDESPLPDGFIGYNGGLVYFDQMRNEFPSLFKVLDPRSHVGRNPEIPLLLVFGDQDFSYVYMPWFKKGVDEMVSMLEKAGHEVQFELWPGIGHSVDSRSIPLIVSAFQRMVRR